MESVMFYVPLLIIIAQHNLGFACVYFKGGIGHYQVFAYRSLRNKGANVFNFQDNKTEDEAQLEVRRIRLSSNFFYSYLSCMF